MGETGTTQDQVDVDTIRTSVRQATEDRNTVPTVLRIDFLVDRLRGHIGLLLEENLGRADDELRSLRAEAEFVLRCGPKEGSRQARWDHAESLGYTTKGLLRRYIEAHPEG